MSQMSVDLSSPQPAVAGTDSPGAVRATGKKKGKVRSAWISFASRIIAQIVGASASLALGIAVIQQYGAGLVSHETATRTGEPTVASAASRMRSAAGQLAVAVLAVENYSGDPGQQHIADSVTEALITQLAQTPNLRVISRTSSTRYKGQQKPLVDIARELDVDLLVEGSIVRSGERVRVTAQLIDGRSDEHLWARSYDRALDDVLRVEAEVATQIAQELVSALRAAKAF